MIDDNEKIRTIQIESVTPLHGMEEEKEETKAHDTLQYHSAQTLMEEGPETQRTLVPNLKHTKTIASKPKLQKTGTSELLHMKTKKAKTANFNKFGSLTMSVTSS